MRGGVVDRARMESGFDEARLDREVGTRVWSGGADLGPDKLYETVRTGLWRDQNLATYR